MPDHPRLAVTAPDIPAIRAMAQTAAGRAMRRALDRALSAAPDGITIGSHAAGHALRHLLTADRSEAERAAARVAEAIAGVPYADSPPLWDAHDFKMIYRTKAAVDVALAYDLCADVWPTGTRRAIARALETRAREFLRGGGRGFNDKPASNWMGNTRAAAGFLALAIEGDPGAGSDLGLVAEEAQAGFQDYLRAAFGNRGWCREGFNYLRYPMATTGFPFLQALSLQQNRDIVTGTPAEWIAPLYITHLVKGPEPTHRPYVPFFGLSYPSSDTHLSGFDQHYERTRWRSGDLVMALGSAAPRFRPALLWTLHSLFGLEGDASFDIHKPADAIYAFANLARFANVGPENPAATLPRALADTALGYFVFRNRWNDAGDCVAALTANASPVPGCYSFQDAGSFRIYGLGVRWAEQAGGSNDLPANPSPRISRAAENVVQCPGTNGWPGGRVLHQDLRADGSASVTLDLSDAYSTGSGLRDAGPGPIRAVRAFAVDYSGDSGCPALIVIADRFDGPGEKRWVMHTAGHPHPDPDGFRIEGPAGASLKATFVQPRQRELRIVPGTQTRTIEVTGGDEFLVALTIQQGPPPEVALEGSTLRVGRARIEIGSEHLQICRPSPKGMDTGA